MDICFGGTVAEELLYGSEGVSSGCASDINVSISFLIRITFAVLLVPLKN